MKYNIDGRFTFSVFAENMEAANDKEAETKFKELITAALNKGGLDVDWMETLDINKESLPDHSEKANNALYNSGYGLKVKSLPKRIGMGLTKIGGKEMGNVELYKAHMKNDKDMVFMLYGGEIYLPCNPKSFFLMQLGCDSSFIDGEELLFDTLDSIFKCYWMKENDVYVLTKNGDFLAIYNSKTNYNPTLGKRLAIVKSKIDDDVCLISSSATELNLCSVTDENVIYNADFNDAHDEAPNSITMTKRIL